MTKPLYFAVFYKIATSTVCRVEHRDSSGDFECLVPRADERMLTVSYANEVNLPQLLRGMGIKL